MTGSGLDDLDAVNLRLRSIVSRVDGAMSSLLTRAVPAVPLDDLLGSWAELVEALALSPQAEPPLCPVCGRSGPWARSASHADGQMASSA